VAKKRKEKKAPASYIVLASKWGASNKSSNKQTNQQERPAHAACPTFIYNLYVVMHATMQALQRMNIYVYIYIHACVLCVCVYALKVRLGHHSLAPYASIHHLLMIVPCSLRRNLPCWILHVGRASASNGPAWLCCGG
jgi:hypothetical protein